MERNMEHIGEFRVELITSSLAEQGTMFRPTRSAARRAAQELRSLGFRPTIFRVISPCELRRVR